MDECLTEQTRLGRMLTLDAMRGGAALAVVTYHALGVAPQTAWHGWEGLLPQITGYVVHYAYAGIYLFFVISGFCIHLFWAKARAAGVQAPVINFFTFWKRRVRRLYPPYIAALVLYLCYLAYKTPVQVTGFYVWDVVLHVFMLHNLDPRTAYSINGAFWTLAIEEQLYLAYFLLLFLRIRYGWTTTLVLCFSLRIAWLIMSRTLGYSFGVEIPLGEAAATNWFIWALGALSVEAALGVIKLPEWCYRMRAAAVALGCAMALAQILPTFDHKNWVHDVGWLIMHPAWGVGFFILVNYSVAAEQRWRLISSRVPALIAMLAPIGLISYSLYLTHSFVLMHWYWFGFTQLHILSISLVIMTPLSVLFAWLFFRVCERPFMRSAAAKAPVESRYPAIMVKYKTLGLVVLLTIGITAVFVVPIHNKAQEPPTATSAAKTQRRVNDENHFPMVEFSGPAPTDPKRKARGEKRNKSMWSVHPDSPGDTTSIVHGTDPSLPAFPNNSAAVVSGTVADAKAYLSNDTTGVYSSFVVIIDEVFKNSGKLLSGKSIEVEREGGRVKFPSGRVHLYVMSEQHMPVLGGRYVFFLANTSEESVFEIVTGYEIRSDAVYALDDLTHAMSYNGTTPASFFKELRTKLPGH